LKPQETWTASLSALICRSRRRWPRWGAIEVMPGPAMRRWVSPTSYQWLATADDRAARSWLGMQARGRTLVVGLGLGDTLSAALRLSQNSAAVTCLESDQDVVKAWCDGDASRGAWAFAGVLCVRLASHAPPAPYDTVLADLDPLVDRDALDGVAWGRLVAPAGRVLLPAGWAPRSAVAGFARRDLQACEHYMGFGGWRATAK